MVSGVLGADEEAADEEHARGARWTPRRPNSGVLGAEEVADEEHARGASRVQRTRRKGGGDQSYAGNPCKRLLQRVGLKSWRALDTPPPRLVLDFVIGTP